MIKKTSFGTFHSNMIYELILDEVKISTLQKSHSLHNYFDIFVKPKS
jgi:hypothetical protein